MKEAIEQIYKNRQKFILIGLTGRIGAGCTTVADFLCKEKDQQGIPLKNFSSGEINDRTRKQIILNNFYHENWTPFIKITVSDVMTLMLLENGIDEFKQLIKEACDECDAFFEQDENKIRRVFEEFESTKINLCFDRKAQDFDKKVTDSHKFIQKKLPDSASAIKEFLKSKGNAFYTKIYQLLGDNLRVYGKPSNISASEKSENIYSISEKVNTFIKIYREVKREKDEPVYIVIDAFRNPIEMMYFKERYSATYLIAINSKDEDITSRLSRGLNLSASDIEQLSKKENPEDDILKNLKAFVSQNIKSCIQKADIHISNSGTYGNNNFNELYGQLIKFISLIQHPGLVTPSNDEKMMQVAFTAKLNSGCLSRQVGAAVTNSSGSLVSIGWNSVAEGQTPCLLRSRSELLSGTQSDSYSDYEKSSKFLVGLKKHSQNVSEKGLNQSFCFKSIYNKIENEKNQVHTRSLHAEENAFLQITKYGGEPVKSGTLYTTASPCELCSKKAYQLGIKRIVYIDPYPGIASKQILQSGFLRPEMALFKGAIGSAYHRLYEQIIPYKDELDGLGASPKKEAAEKTAGVCTCGASCSKE
ncbi:MAG: hypothetical protein RBS36_07370 [Thiomicrospira sp.]|jgi:dCMP deaminase|nr:hypothetical protein [Thiomicrospira sp.]